MIKIPFGHYRGFVKTWFPFGEKPRWKAEHVTSHHMLSADDHSTLMNMIDHHECPVCQAGRDLEWRNY